MKIISLILFFSFIFFNSTPDKKVELKGFWLLVKETHNKKEVKIYIKYTLNGKLTVTEYDPNGEVVEGIIFSEEESCVLAFPIELSDKPQPKEKGNYEITQDSLIIFTNLTRRGNNNKKENRPDKQFNIQLKSDTLILCHKTAKNSKSINRCLYFVKKIK